MAFPSTLSTFTRPTTSDKLNSPSHSDLHNTVSSALGQVEAVIGVEGSSSVLGTLMTIVKSPGSDGGGHVQSANKGGTGQTVFAKGDLLVGQSSSVLVKQTVGTTGQILSADSTEASGIKWIANNAPKIAVSASVTTVTAVDTETSFLSVTIPGSTLGTANAVRARLFVDQYSKNADGTRIKAFYGATSIATINISSGGAVSSIKGTLDIIILGNNTASSQRGNTLMEMRQNQLGAQSTSVIGINFFQSTVISEDSGADKTLGITVIHLNTAQNEFTSAGYVVEKIN